MIALLLVCHWVSTRSYKIEKYTVFASFKHTKWLLVSCPWIIVMDASSNSHDEVCKLNEQWTKAEIWTNSVQLLHHIPTIKWTVAVPSFLVLSIKSRSRPAIMYHVTFSFLLLVWLAEHSVPSWSGYVLIQSHVPSTTMYMHNTIVYSQAWSILAYLQAIMLKHWCSCLCAIWYCVFWWTDFDQPKPHNGQTKLIMAVHNCQPICKCYNCLWDSIWNISIF